MKNRRRLARNLAFQTLFELESRPEREIEGTLEARVREIEEESPHAVDRDQRLFSLHLVSRTLEMREDLDRRIHGAAPAFPVAQMPRTDRVALELGVYELVYEPSARLKIVINEAVELAKMYGGENSGRFVNGVLGTIAEGLAPSGTVSPAKSEASSDAPAHYLEKTTGR